MNQIIYEDRLNQLREILQAAKQNGIPPGILVEALAVEYLPREPQPTLAQTEEAVNTLSAPGPAPKR